MPTPFDQDSYPTSPPTAPSPTVPSAPPVPASTTAPWPTGEPSSPTLSPTGTGRTRGRLSGLTIAVVVAVAILVGSVAGGTASWFAFARSDSSLVPTRNESTSSAAGTTRPETSAQPLRSWDEVSAAVNPGVVDIESQMSSGVGAGTGMILTSDGRVLTNNHVVEGARSIVVTIATTGATYRAQIVGTDPDEDVAVLQLERAEDLSTIPVGDSDQLAVGDRVAAIGNSGGAGGIPSIATGRVTALSQQITATAEDGSDAQTLDDMIQVAADVVPGDSGGPLADDRGTVVGMTTAASIGNGTGRLRASGGSSASVGYAIPIGRALEIVEEIVATGGTSRSPATSSGGYLGVQATAGTGDGVELAGVMSGSPAAGAGLQVGDTVVAIDDERIETPDQLVRMLSEHDAGDEVRVTWFDRIGRAHQASVTLAAR